MSCYRVKTASGSIGFLCGSLELGVCVTCGLVGDILCDYPVGDGKTCDRECCDDHGTQVGDDLHYCAAHYERWLAWARENDVVTMPAWQKGGE